MEQYRLTQFADQHLEEIPDNDLIRVRGADLYLGKDGTAVNSKREIVEIAGSISRPTIVVKSRYEVKHINYRHLLNQTLKNQLWFKNHFTKMDNLSHIGYYRHSSGYVVHEENILSPINDFVEEMVYFKIEDNPTLWVGSNLTVVRSEEYPTQENPGSVETMKYDYWGSSDVIPRHLSGVAYNSEWFHKNFRTCNHLDGVVIDREGNIRNESLLTEVLKHVSPSDNKRHFSHIESGALKSFSRDKMHLYYNVYHDMDKGAYDDMVVVRLLSPNSSSSIVSYDRGINRVEEEETILVHKSLIGRVIYRDVGDYRYREIGLNQILKKPVYLLKGN